MRRHMLIMMLCLSLFAAACGTRLDDADFQMLSQGGTEAGAVSEDGAAVSEDGAPLAGAEPGASGVGSAAPGSGGGEAAPGAGGGEAAPGAGGKANGATDIGVTATTITVGNVVTKSGAFGPNQFTGHYYGAAAYFTDLNARGGINGRKIKFNFCDDKGSASGNIQCVRRAVDDQKSFAIVGYNCLVCDGLKYASEKKVPMVGGLAIDSRDYALPFAWRYSGNRYPQNGEIGYKGSFYGGTQVYRFFKENYAVKKAGVFYYNDSLPSKNAGLQTIDALEAEGIEAVGYPINLALPNYDSPVIDMKSRGITAVWDAIDIAGNQNLCKSIDSNGLKLTAKVSTISTFTEEVGEKFNAPCRTYVFSTEVPGGAGYHDTSNPEVAKFRAAMKRYFPTREKVMYQWTLDGWGGAMWFADAVASCGADVTRACVTQFLDKPGGYTARGIWTPRGNDKIDFDKQKTLKECIQVSQWDDKAGTFVTRGSYKTTCYTTPLIKSPAPL